MITESDLSAEDLADLDAGRIGALLARHGRTSLTIETLTIGGHTWPGGHHFYVDVAHRDLWPPTDEGREGWRLWSAAPDGRLYPPLAGRVWPPVAGCDPVHASGGAVASACRRAGVHALRACTCGVRYVPDAGDFADFLGLVRAAFDMPGWPPPPGWELVAARGYAEGEIDLDVTAVGDGFRLAPQYRRCERFRVADWFRTN